MSRILITGNNEAIDRDDVTSVLIAERHEWRVTDVPSATGVLRAWRPDVVIVDVPGEDFDGAAMVATLRSGENPDSRAIIIVLGFETSAEARIAVLQAGGDLFMTKPVNPFEFRARLVSLLGKRGAPVPAIAAEAPKEGQILAFYGSKGGAGSTTVAINTAIALRRLTSARVCLIDGNFQFGDHRIFLDFGLDRPGIDDIVVNGFEPEQVLNALTHHETEIDVLLAPKSPEAADLLTPEAVTNILTQLRSRYDYVVIDLERHIDERTLSILDLSNQVFLIMSADLPGLKNTRLTRDMLQALDFAEERVQLLLNRAGSFTGIKLEEAERVLGRKIDHQIANEYRGAVSALNSGSPTSVAKADSILGKEFARLAKAIVTPTAVVLLARPGDKPKQRLLSAGSDR